MAQLVSCCASIAGRAFVVWLTDKETVKMESVRRLKRKDVKWSQLMTDKEMARTLSVEWRLA